MKVLLEAPVGPRTHIYVLLESTRWFVCWRASPISVRMEFNSTYITSIMIYHNLLPYTYEGFRSLRLNRLNHNFWSDQLTRWRVIILAWLKRWNSLIQGFHLSSMLQVDLSHSVLKDPALFFCSLYKLSLLHFHSVPHLNYFIWKCFSLPDHLSFVSLIYCIHFLTSGQLLKDPFQMPLWLNNMHQQNFWKFCADFKLVIDRKAELNLAHPLFETLHLVFSQTQYLLEFI